MVILDYEGLSDFSGYGQATVSRGKITTPSAKIPVSPKPMPRPTPSPAPTPAPSPTPTTPENGSAVDVVSIHAGEMEELKKFIDFQREAKLKHAEGVGYAYIDQHYRGLKNTAENLDKAEGTLSWAEKQRYLAQTALGQYYGTGKQISDLLAKQKRSLAAIQPKAYKAKVEAMTVAKTQFVQAGVGGQFKGIGMALLFGAVGLVGAVAYYKYFRK